MKRAIIAILALVVCLIVCTIPVSAQEIIEITSKQLYDEYDENEIRADQRYKGKVFEVSGEIDNIGKSSWDEKPYMTLKAGFLGSVGCRFDFSWESK